MILKNQVYFNNVNQQEIILSLQNFCRKNILQTEVNCKVQKKRQQYNLMVQETFKQRLDNKINSSMTYQKHNQNLLRVKRIDNSKNKYLSQSNIQIQTKLIKRQSQQIKRDQKQKPNKFNLTNLQLQEFGDRFPQKYHKLRLLGRGGFSLVWLGIHKKTKQKFAIKQILSKNNHQTHLKQIWFGSFFFQFGKPREQLSLHPGIKNLAIMISYQIKQIDTWIFYQLCDQTLGSALYEISNQKIVQNQKIYRMQYLQLYEKFQESVFYIKHFIIEMAKVLSLLADHNIVHSDIKTQNILIKRNQNNTFSYKLIDYGSSFLFTNLKQFTMATPQYMAPQILNFILYQNDLEYNKQMLKMIKTYKNESAIDIWSVGCIILQIIHGIPLWMSIKTKLSFQNQDEYHYGLFGVKGRIFNKIIQKQRWCINNIDDILKTSNSGCKIDEQVIYILKRMLDLDGQKRIRPGQILKYFKIRHQYERNYINE